MNKLLQKFNLLLAGIVMFSFIPNLLFSQADISKKNVITDYSLTERKNIPVEYTWKIDDIYPSIDDWKKDKEVLLKMTDQIDEVRKEWTAAPKKMLSLLELLEKIYMKGIKLYSYASHQSNSDIGNTVFQNMKGEIQFDYVNLSAKTSFIDPEILALGNEKFAQYLKEEPGLKQYRFMIENTLRGKDHVLPDEQQKIVSLTGSFTNVPSSASRTLNNLEIPPVEVTLSDHQKVTLTQSNLMRYRASTNPDDRTLVMSSYFENQNKFKTTFATLLEGAMKEHYFHAKVEKHKDCLSNRLFGDNIPVEVYYTLIKSVRKNLNPLHRYLEIKRKLLGLKKFRYEDIYASAVPSVEKSYTYADAQKVILEAMEPLGKEYIDALKTAFNNRWIDLYPNKGKESGAYSGGVYGVHPYIKMNYIGKYNDVSTLAHELGHAMHSHFSNKAQTFTNSQYATFLAEIASTFNENMLMSYLLKNEKDDLFKLFILDQYLEQIRGTVYRQTLFAEFELAMHKRIEEGKALTSDWLSKEYLDITRVYYGQEKGVCDVGDYLKSEWSFIPHFFMNYYVFQYSTGMIASTALCNMVLNGGADEKEKYLSLLKGRR